ncbi:MAG: hypothetical protein GQ574_00210 [Crocinitomix sp.]|nr:hypothetical protein [Crocinitomix sp.]
MKFLRKIGPFILIPLMLFSSTGFSLDVHFCGDEVKSVGLFNATPCDMEESMNQSQDLSNLPPCHRKMILDAENSTPKNGLNQRPCCHNETFDFEVSSDVEPLLIQKVDLTQVNAVIVYAAINFNLFQRKVELEFYENYRPPLIDADISVLHQVFRI